MLSKEDEAVFVSELFKFLEKQNIKKIYIPAAVHLRTKKEEEDIKIINDLSSFQSLVIRDSFLNLLIHFLRLYSIPNTLFLIHGNKFTNDETDQVKIIFSHFYIFLENIEKIIKFFY